MKVNNEWESDGRPSLGGLGRGWNTFFHSAMDGRTCAYLRIGFGVLLLINFLVQGLDLETWYGEGGVMPYEASRRNIDPDCHTLFSLLPKTDATLWSVYAIMLVQITLLIAGVFPRVQAACLFVWLVSFHHRNNLLLDGTDLLFRLTCFFMIFMPLASHWSFHAWRRKRRAGGGAEETRYPVWSLRLAQLELTAVYLSTLLRKLDGASWLDGTALYYVYRLDDLFGKVPLPAVLTDSLPMIRLATWSVLVIEFLLVFGPWFRETRRATIIIGVLFHLGIELTMNLFLFQWLMILLLLTHVRKEDLEWARGIVVKFRSRRAPGRSVEALP